MYVYIFYNLSISACRDLNRAPAEFTDHLER